MHLLCALKGQPLTAHLIFEMSIKDEVLCLNIKASIVPNNRDNYIE